MPERKTIEVLIGQKEPAGEIVEELKGEKAPRPQEVSGRWRIERVECPWCGCINVVYASDNRSSARVECWGCGQSIYTPSSSV